MIATVLLAPLIRHVMLTAPLGLVLVLALHPDVLMAAFIPLIISRRRNVAYTRWRVFVPCRGRCNVDVHNDVGRVVARETPSDDAAIAMANNVVRFFMEIVPFVYEVEL